MNSKDSLDICKADIDRFWANIQKNNRGCWVWTGPTTTAGKGRIHISGRYQYANRVAWYLENGSMPARLRPLCSTEGCVNPAHLSDGSTGKKVRSSQDKGVTSGVDAQCSPDKPYPEFPLYAHRRGQWAKKVRNKTYYFGTWADPEAALALWKRQEADLRAGRPPREVSEEGLTIEDLRTHFLNSKTRQHKSGELTRRSYDEYKECTDLLVREFGQNRYVEDLGPDDFADLRATMSNRWGPRRLNKFIGMTLTTFKFAFANNLIAEEVKCGTEFARASRLQIRKVRAEAGKKMFTPEQVKDLLEKASPTLKAMILLAINTGMGNTDVALLRLQHFDGEWIDYPRRKTGIERRIHLWPETIEAIEVVKDKKKPKPFVLDVNGELISSRDLIFFTKYGKSWCAPDSPANPLSARFTKLLKETGHYRKGLGFYTFRHIFETIGIQAEGAGQVHVNALMGHADPSMAGDYREGLKDEHVKRVTDHIREWLFGKPEQTEEEKLAAAAAALGMSPEELSAKLGEKNED